MFYDKERCLINDETCRSKKEENWKFLKNFIETFKIYGSKAIEFIQFEDFGESQEDISKTNFFLSSFIFLWIRPLTLTKVYEKNIEIYMHVHFYGRHWTVTTNCQSSSLIFNIKYLKKIYVIKFWCKILKFLN